MVKEFTDQKGYHLHLLLTFSTGEYKSFTILTEVNKAICLLPLVKGSIAQPRWKWNENDEAKFFHRLTIESQLYDAVLRYSYLAKNETKEKFKGTKIVASKFPAPYKTKQGQSKRIRTLNKS